jgi:two-component system osmolarity sensor histidine kinase EnvZ
MLPARFDSLFMRLLLAQLVLVFCCVMIFGGFVVVERNTLQMPQFAEVWAPAFTAAAARPPSVDSTPVFGLPTGIQRHAGAPTAPRLEVTNFPSGKALREGLAARGVEVDQLWFNLSDGRLTMWSHMPSPHGPGAWLSGQAPSLLPRWTTRTTVTFALLLIAVAGVSWNFSRRVTRPLDRLRQRMQAHAQTGNEPAQPPLTSLNRGAPPELIEMDAAYTQLAQRLQRNERERALLLAGVSHDLRSPLSRIRLAAEMLPESADNLDGVASITRNVDHADQLIASFLEFVRASAPGSEAEGQVDLVATARQAVSRFERSPHQLALRAPASLTLQRAPGLLVERLVANLVDNALKHGALPVVVSLTSDGDAALLTVADAGPGLPQVAGLKLTEAFARGDASRGLPGVGLGLAIAQQIVLRLGGELSFEHDAAGHRVRVRLPFTR